MNRIAVVTATIGYAVIGLVLLLMVVAVVGWVKYWHLQDQVTLACQGVPAQLDLTSWAPLCRDVQ